MHSRDGTHDIAARAVAGGWVGIVLRLLTIMYTVKLRQCVTETVFETSHNRLFAQETILIYSLILMEPRFYA